ncbi:MAG: hypothetical protein ACXWL5_02850, partial [Candidatus Chromulinivorax sp.]
VNPIENILSNIRFESDESQKPFTANPRSPAEGFVLASNLEKVPDKVNSAIEQGQSSPIEKTQPARQPVRGTAGFSFNEQAVNRNSISAENSKSENASTELQKNQQKKVSSDTAVKVDVAQLQGNYNNFLQAIEVDENSLKSLTGFKSFFLNPSKINRGENVKNIQDFYEKKAQEVNDVDLLISKDIDSLKTKIQDINKNKSDSNLSTNLNILLKDAEQARQEMRLRADYRRFYDAIFVNEESLKTSENNGNSIFEENIKNIEEFYQKKYKDVNEQYVVISKDIISLENKINSEGGNFKKNLNTLLADAKEVQTKIKDEVINNFKTTYLPLLNQEDLKTGIPVAQYSLVDVEKELNKLTTRLKQELNIEDKNSSALQKQVQEIYNNVEEYIEAIKKQVNILRISNSKIDTASDQKKIEYKSLEDAINDAEKTLQKVFEGTFFTQDTNVTKDSIKKYYPQAIAELKLELKIENKVNTDIKRDVEKKVNDAWQDITQSGTIDLTKYDKQLIDEIEKISNNDKNSGIEVVKDIVEYVKENKNKDLKIELEAKKRDLKALDSREGKIIQTYLNVIDGLQRKIDVERNINIGVQSVLDTYYSNNKKITYKTKIDDLIKSKSIPETDEFIRNWNKLFQENNITNSVDSSKINFKFLENLSKNDLQAFITRLKNQKQEIDARIKSLPKDNIELIKGISVVDVKTSEYDKIKKELTKLQDAVKSNTKISEQDKASITEQLDKLLQDYTSALSDNQKLIKIDSIINSFEKLGKTYPDINFKKPFTVISQIKLTIEQFQNLYMKVESELIDLQKLVLTDTKISELSKEDMRYQIDELLKNYTNALTDDEKLKTITDIINKIKELYIQCPVSELNVTLQVISQIKPKIEQLQKYTQLINNFFDLPSEELVQKLNKWPEKLKKAEALSENDKKDLLDFIDNSNGRKLTTIDITPQEIKALYEKINQEIQLKEKIKFNNTGFGKISNFLGISGFVAQTVKGVGSGITTVGDAVDAFKNIFVGVTFSAGTLGAIGIILKEYALYTQNVQNNNNLTDDQKKKLKEDAFSSVLEDVAVLVLADQTGADLDTVKVLADNLLTGNASADDMQNVAINAGFNKAIQSLSPEAKNMQIQMNLKNFDSSFKKFENQYDIWSKKQEAGVATGPLPSFTFANGMSSQDYINRAGSYPSYPYVQPQVVAPSSIAPRRAQTLGGIGAQVPGMSQQPVSSAQSYQNVPLYNFGSPGAGGSYGMYLPANQQGSGLYL